MSSPLRCQLVVLYPIFRMRIPHKGDETYHLLMSSATAHHFVHPHDQDSPDKTSLVGAHTALAGALTKFPGARRVSNSSKEISTAAPHRDLRQGHAARHNAYDGPPYPRLVSAVSSGDARIRRDVHRSRSSPLPGRTVPPHSAHPSSNLQFPCNHRVDAARPPPSGPLLSPISRTA
jgi:hypothetical protein